MQDNRVATESAGHISAVTESRNTTPADGNGKDNLHALARELRGKLQPQEIDFLRYYLGIQPVSPGGHYSHGDKTNSMRAAGFTENSKGALSHRADSILLRARIPIQVILHAKGISLDLIADTIRNGFSAVKSNGIADHTERGRWADRALSLLGYGHRGRRDVVACVDDGSSDTARPPAARLYPE